METVDVRLINYVKVVSVATTITTFVALWLIMLV